MTTDFATDPARNCAGVTTDLFYDDDQVFRDLARAACRRCPVRHACLQHAVDQGEQWGIWGGVLFSSERERTAARRGLRSTADRVAELWRHGLSDTSIARQLGVHPTTVRDHRHRLGLAANYRSRRKLAEVNA